MVMQSIEGGHAWYRQGLASSYIAILIKVKRGGIPIYLRNSLLCL